MTSQYGKNVKAILFASLIATVTLPFSVMEFAEAEKTNGTTDKQKVNEPKIKQLLKKIVKETGKTREFHQLRDGSIATIDYDVKKVNDQSYTVHLIAELKSQIINEQNFVVTNNPDSSVNMRNDAVGIDVDFIGKDTVPITNSAFQITMPSNVAGKVLGSGSSSGSGARIDLYDSGVKQPDQVLNLDDSYSGCLGTNAGSFDAQVFVDLVTWVDWDANSTYWHWCISPYSYNGGEIIHEGKKKKLSSSETSGRWITSNTGTNPYSVEVEYTYGSW